jgi:hypothetical protein
MTPTIPRGLFRTEDHRSGVRYAWVRCSGDNAVRYVFERTYRNSNYRPLFDDLPTEEQYNAAQAKKHKTVATN